MTDPGLTTLEDARADLRRAIAAGEPLDKIVDALVLHANLGGHTGIPACQVDAGARFFARHLR